MSERCESENARLLEQLRRILGDKANPNCSPLSFEHASQEALARVMDERDRLREERIRLRDLLAWCFAEWRSTGEVDGGAPGRSWCPHCGSRGHAVECRVPEIEREVSGGGEDPQR